MFNQDTLDKQIQESDDSRPQPASGRRLVPPDADDEPWLPSRLGDLSASDEGFIPQPGEDNLPADREHSI